MSDTQYRGKILKILYDRRNNADGWVPVSDIDLAGGPPVSMEQISSVCRQLADANLIRWKPVLAAGSGGIAGMGQITGPGVDVVETGRSPSLRIEFSRNVAVPGAHSDGGAGYFYDVPSLAEVSGKGTVAGGAPVLSQTVEPQDTIVPFAVGPPLDSGRLAVPTAQEAISLRPTVYPDDPTGAVMVQNFITINVRGPDFRNLSENMDRLFAELRQSNVIAGEVRDKLIAEMEAGLKVLASPKPDPKILEVFLVRPLRYIGDKAAGPVIGTLALAVLALIGRMTGMF